MVAIIIKSKTPEPCIPIFCHSCVKNTEYDPVPRSYSQFIKDAERETCETTLCIYQQQNSPSQKHYRTNDMGFSASKRKGWRGNPRLKEN